MTRKSIGTLNLLEKDLDWLGCSFASNIQRWISEDNLTRYSISVQSIRLFFVFNFETECGACSKI